MIHLVRPWRLCGSSTEKAPNYTRHRLRELPLRVLRVLHVEQPDASHVPDPQGGHTAHVDLAPD